MFEFAGVSRLLQWHLEFTKTLRRFRGRKLSGLDIWDQEEAGGSVYQLYIDSDPQSYLLGLAWSCRVTSASLEVPSVRVPRQHPGWA